MYTKTKSIPVVRGSAIFQVLRMQARKIDILLPRYYRGITDVHLELWL
jgi:hypothetical protein